MLTLCWATSMNMYEKLHKGCVLNFGNLALQEFEGSHEKKEENKVPIPASTDKRQEVPNFTKKHNTRLSFFNKPYPLRRKKRERKVG